jgi:3-isopropylmalate dehydrogenase
VRRPWDFDVMVTENMFGDILSDLGRRADRRHGLCALGRYRRRPRRVPAVPRLGPDIAGQGKANPTAMFLSAAMMLEWLGLKHANPAH